MTRVTCPVCKIECKTKKLFLEHICPEDIPQGPEPEPEPVKPSRVNEDRPVETETVSEKNISISVQFNKTPPDSVVLVINTAEA